MRQLSYLTIELKPAKRPGQFCFNVIRQSGQFGLRRIAGKVRMALADPGDQRIDIFAKRRRSQLCLRQCRVG